MKYSIKKNRWDNWYGYYGNKKVISFHDNHLETQEQMAQRWLENKAAIKEALSNFIELKKQEWKEFL